MELELEYLQEVFGLEEVDFPSDKVQRISDSTLRALYSQLSKDELLELVDLYHVDLEMFQYSPQKFLAMMTP